VVGSEALVLAVPLDGLDDAVASIGAFGGVVIDAVNAVRHPVPGGHDSVSAHLASLLPDASVAKAFNTVGFEVMLDPLFPAGRAVLPIAGHEVARGVAGDLGTAIGFDVLEVGDLDAVPLVEAWAKVWIRSMVAGRGRTFAFGILDR
jgi:8-hydroxy-5-deazaflavin:NADPH oxidoreductase